MIVKGVVSAVKGNKAAVILPEYNSVTTEYLPVYPTAEAADLKVNDFVLVNFFNDDFNDGIVLNRGNVGGGSAGYRIIPVTQDEYDEILAAGAIEKDALYMIVIEGG